MKHFSQAEIEVLADRERKALGLEQLPIEVEDLIVSLTTIPLHFEARSEVLDDEGSRLEGGLFQGDPYTIAVEEQVLHPERMLFTIAHELGHYVLHMREQDDAVSRLVPQSFHDRFDNFLVSGAVDHTVGSYFRLEWEANSFASALLMPADQVSMLYPEYKTRLDEFAERFGVSSTVMQRRLVDLGLVPKWRLEDRPQNWEFAGIRALHFADAHLGVERYARKGQTRLSEFASRLSDIGKAVRQNDIDVVLFSGDAFKDREPGPEQLVTFAQAILDYRTAGAEVVLLVGNHDLGAMTVGGSISTHALSIYQKLLRQGVHVLDRDEVLTLTTRHGTVQIAGLPYLPPRAHLPTGWEHLSPAERYEAVIQGVRKRVDTLVEKVRNSGQGDPVILMAHLTVEGAAVGAERRIMLGQDLAVPAEVLDREPFSYVALGHVHRYQHLGGRLVYSGSIDRIDFGERHDKKGFVLVDVKPDRTRFIQVPLENVTDYVDLRISVPDSTPNPTKAVLQYLERCVLDDKVVRVTVVSARSVWNLLRQSELLAALEKRARHVVGIRAALTDGHDQPYDDELAIKSLEPVEALREFLEAEGRPDSQSLLELAAILEREFER